MLGMLFGESNVVLFNASAFKLSYKRFVNRQGSIVFASALELSRDE